MNILLTGGTGLVGSNIREYNEKNKNYNLLTPTHEEMDLLDRNSIVAFFEKNDFEYIVHAAGRVGGIHTNMSDKSGFMHDNMIMGFNLLSVAQEFGIKNFLNFGTSCMYPAEAVSPISEDKIFDGKMHESNEGYAIAKSALAKMCELIGGNYKTVIPCNLYGKYDKFDPALSHMLPAAIRKIHVAKASGAPVEIWGDGQARREFMYAQDVADFVFYALENMDTMPQYVNLGLETDYSIRELYQAAAEVIGYEGEFVYDTSKPVGVMKKKCDITKLGNFGWSAKYSAKEGISETYEYFKELESV